MHAHLVRSSQKGFTLIEMVIGITTFAVALTIITSVLNSQVTKSADPIFQVRSTELAQSMFNEILGKYYDENADRNGGIIRCNEDLPDDTDESICTAVAALGPDTGESSRPDFDDVDDYHDYGVTRDGSGAITSYNPIQNSLGQNISTENNGDLYTDFGVLVEVIYDANHDGIADSSSGNVKLITVSVHSPSGEKFVFSSYKHNY